jgi:hypothetical protein
MKKLVAYCLLLVYTMTLCKPVLPYVNDALSHFLFEQEHFAVIHAHHGDKHLHHELVQAGKEENDHQNKSTVKTEEPLAVHNTIAEKENELPVISLSSQQITAGKQLPQLSKEVNYPPPRS